MPTGVGTRGIPLPSRPAARRLRTRIEHDSLGEVRVPARAPWGAQTQRALRHFAISSERMPIELLRALALLKQCAAEANADLGQLDTRLARAIADAAAQAARGAWDHAFVLKVWQSGSGTQSHMNLNEVLARQASRCLGGRVVHPNDHVNRGQSSNDMVPSAMHVAAAQALRARLLPALRALRATLRAKAGQFDEVLKVGRTHLQDATPLRLGQEISGWAAQLDAAQAGIEASQPALYELAVGATAVGTGINTHPAFGATVCARLARATGLPWLPAANPFAALAAHDALVALHAALKGLAVALLRIADDLRWLASGPRCGIGELQLPANEPGSSIMPGKVNPTQCEALLMVCYQVLGNDVALGCGAAAGRFELNTCKPLIAHNLLQSLRLLGDGMRSFEVHCVRGMRAERQRIAELLGRSLMAVTALAPHIGHERAARLARHAELHAIGLREAFVRLLPELYRGDDAGARPTLRDFDRWVDPARMVDACPTPRTGLPPRDYP